MVNFSGYEAISEGIAEGQKVRLAHTPTVFANVLILQY
jgi:hypothetical protein